MANNLTLSPVWRVKIWYAIIIIVCTGFMVKLFYLQIIKHEHYKIAALSKQLKEYEIPAERGVIEARDGDERVPIVLNETKYTLYADPKFVTNTVEAARAIEKIIGGDINEYEKAMKADSRYAVLAKKLDKNQKKSVDDLNLKGIGTREAIYRSYPQGTLGSQLLGFVNDENEGKYGLEQALNDKLKGTPGLLKAITDARGVPLAANKDNTLISPKSGKRTVLTMDVGMQRQLEDILKSGLEHAKSESGGALIIDVKDGAIKAMANYPTYDPSDFFNVDANNVGVFENKLVSSPLEVGSVMKPFTMAAAIDTGAITASTTFYDPGQFKIDDATITNVEESGGPGNKEMKVILQKSLNTGATWLLMQMGGGTINQKARETWHNYMTDHYRFGRTTNIEQGYENGGNIPDPNEGFGLNIQYANSAFGQGMTATPLQIGAALASVINGGKYYKPHLVESYIDSEGNEEKQEPEIVRNNVVKPEVSKDIISMMQYVFSTNHRVYGMPQLRSEFTIGGKTGTAQVPKPEGGYYDDRYNGMFMGFVGGNNPEYAIVVRVNEPKIAGYAGSTGAGPIFVGLANMLIDNFGVSPRY